MGNAQALFGRMLAAIREFRETSRQAFNLLLGAIGLGVALSLGFYLVDPGAPVTLVSNLSPADHTALALRLRRHGIRFTLGPDSIMVPSGQLREAERVLEGSPGFTGGGEDFSLFDRAAMGQSEFDEQVNYQRSLQGELERTIMNIRGVENARVMLAMGRPSPFALGTSEAARASVMLTTVQGAVIDEAMARAIAHLVAGSVRGLAVEDVTVTTNDGRTLFPVPHDGELGEAIALRNEYERSLEQKASALLNRIMGTNRFAVEVSVDVDSSRVTSKEQTFGDHAILSEEHQVTPAGLPDIAAGIPGLTSNLPVPSPAATPAAPAAEANPANPAAAPNPNPTAESAKTAGYASAGSASSRKDIVNYKPSSHEVDTENGPARIKRVSIAVVLDGTYDGGQFKALPKERLDAIKGLLAAAVGAQTDRGDSIQVQCAALSQPYIPPVPNPVTQIRTLIADPKYFYAAIGLGLVLLLLIFWIVTRAARRLFRRAPATATVSAAAAPAAVAAAAAPPEPAPEPKISVVLTPDLEAPPTYEQLRARVNQKAQREPEAIAQILRQWLEATNGTAASNGHGAEATPS